VFDAGCQVGDRRPETLVQRLKLEGPIGIVGVDLNFLHGATSIHFTKEDWGE
jgi:hypothetical protein